MTTLRNESGKVIQYSIGNTIYESSRDMCIIEMPVIICNNRKDAELMQEEIGAFVGKLSKAILEND